MTMGGTTYYLVYEKKGTPYLLFQSGQRQHRGEVPVVGADDPAGELRRQ